MTNMSVGDKTGNLSTPGALSDISIDKTVWNVDLLAEAAASGGSESARSCLGEEEEEEVVGRRRRWWWWWGGGGGGGRWSLHPQRGFWESYLELQWFSVYQVFVTSVCQNKVSEL